MILLQIIQTLIGKVVGTQSISHVGSLTNLAKKSSIDSPDIKGAVIIIEELVARKKLMQSWLFINLDEFKLLFQLLTKYILMPEILQISLLPLHQALQVILQPLSYYYVLIVLCTVKWFQEKWVRVLVQMSRIKEKETQSYIWYNVNITIGRPRVGLCEA